MQKIGQNGEDCHGDRKANPHSCKENGLKMPVVVVVFRSINAPGGGAGWGHVVSRADVVTTRTGILSPFSLQERGLALRSP